MATAVQGTTSSSSSSSSSFISHNGTNSTTTTTPAATNGTTTEGNLSTSAITTTTTTSTDTATATTSSSCSSVVNNENNANNANGTEDAPEVDIVINNVVCSFSVRCHLNLRDIALRGINVEYRKENGMVTMKLRRPYTTASMWSSGKITCTGANSEEQARIAARKYARVLQKLGFKIRFKNFRVVNVLGTCTLPFGIKIANFSQAHREASYEPELHPGVTYKLVHPKATLKIFSTGSITVTAPSVNNVQAAIEHIFPLVYDFRKPKTIADIKKPVPEVPNKRSLPSPPSKGTTKKPKLNSDIKEEEEDEEVVVVAERKGDDDVERF